MITKYCPNKNLPEWKELVSVVNENQAYYLWNKYKGDGSLALKEALDSSKSMDTDKKNINLSEIGNFTNTTQIIDYLLASPGIHKSTKALLSELRGQSTRLIIKEHSIKNESASYDGDVILNINRLNKASNQNIAEDVAHEMIHHYLLKYYSEHPEFQKLLKDLLDKYKYIDPNEYGFTSPNEFLTEFMSNSSFRFKLSYGSKSFFEKIITFIVAALRKLFTGKKSYRSLPKDLKQLEDEVWGLLSKVNKGDIEYYTAQDDLYKYYKKSSTTTPEADKLLEKILKGLKQRLESVKRYSKKNIIVENELNKLISDLNVKDSIDGIVEFIDHVNDSINDSITFLNKQVSNINYKLIRLLSEDYVGFYKPLLEQVQYLIDTTDEFKSLPEYNDFENLVLDINTTMNTVNNKFTNISRSKGKQLLVDHLIQNATPQEFIDRIINWLDNPSNDGNFLTTWVGMASNSRNEIVSTIANILNNAMNKVLRNTYSKGIELVKILQKAKEEFGDDVLKLLYERLFDGTYSGYMVRDLNYGLMYKNFREYSTKLAEKLGIEKDKEGKFIMPDDEDIIDKWYDGLNKFYSKHTNRRYTDEYYTLRNKIFSKVTKDALDDINEAINQILDPVNIDGVIYENLLTDDQFVKLESLRKSKKMLACQYNLDGTLKTGIDKTIADEIQKFNELVTKLNKYIADWNKFRKDEAKVIKRYGKDSEQHKKWVQLNTRTQYKLEFWDELDKLSKPIQTARYLELVEKRRQITNILKDNHTGLYNVDELSDRDKLLIKLLDLDIADEYTPNIPGTASVFSNIAEIIYTELYYKDYNAATAAGKDVFDHWFNDNHYEDYRGNMKPCSYYTKLKPIDELRYIETVPTGRYMTIDVTSKYFNKDFDVDGPAIQPKRELYDNSTAYNKIMNNKSLKDLYDAVRNTMVEANNMISYITSTDTYKMPQMTARFLLALGRQNGLKEMLNYTFNEVATTREDDTEYVEEFVTKPNGKPLKVIPTRYMKMLDNPNNISTDAVFAAVEYYEMAKNYSVMSDILDLIELLLNLLEQSTYTSKSTFKNKGSLDYYKQAQALVDRIMYGRKVTPLKVNAFGKEINVSKILNNIRNYVSKVNLSFNINSIGVSFFTDATYTTIESFLGRHFSTNDLAFATRQFQHDLPDILANTGNPIPTNITGYLMQLNQVVRDNKEIFARLDLSAALKALNLNFWYLGYTQSDYTVKSHTLLSVYHSYKFVKGEGFLSRNEYINKFYPTDRKRGRVAFDHLNSDTLFDAYEKTKDGFEVKYKYKPFVKEKLLNDVKNKIEVISKRIDGTMRDIDKANVHANSITAYLTQHRNFMISGLHDRFKLKQFNQDLGVVEEGYYRSIGRFISNIIGDRHYALTLILADYDNLDEYEQYGVRRVLYDMMLVASTSIVALTLMNIVDGDDDYSNWITEEITYLALRSAFEFRSMYNPMEFMSLIKSPTAAFNWFDNSWNILGIFNPINYIYGKSPFATVDRGVYKDWPKILKTIVKVTPAKNIIEAQDPKAKRTYLKNQLMSF